MPESSVMLISLSSGDLYLSYLHMQIGNLYNVNYSLLKYNGLCQRPWHLQCTIFTSLSDSGLESIVNSM